MIHFVKNKNVFEMRSITLVKGKNRMTVSQIETEIAHFAAHQQPIVIEKILKAFPILKQNSLT